MNPMQFSIQTPMIRPEHEIGHKQLAVVNSMGSSSIGKQSQTFAWREANDEVA
jgi:uncharacterized protein (UPF0210 family)